MNDTNTSSSNGRADAAARPRKVMKFGGTSVGRPERMRQVVRLVEDAAREHRPVVVASALSGVTRRLDAALDDVAAGRLPVEQAVEAMRMRHGEQASEILSPEARGRYEAALERQLDNLRTALQEAATAGASPSLRDRVLATGELCSVPMLAAALEDAGVPAAYGVSTDLFVTDDTFGAACVDTDASRENICAFVNDCAADAVPLMAGYIGATSGGRVTTLGFEGSDYSAALVAAFLGASVFERWTDVDALYTADPRTDEHAERIDELTMDEAARLNAEGGLGMHPKALRPLLAAGIPAHIRGTTQPGAPGTRIRAEGVLTEEAPVAEEQAAS